MQRAAPTEQRARRKQQANTQKRLTKGGAALLPVALGEGGRGGEAGEGEDGEEDGHFGVCWPVKCRVGGRIPVFGSARRAMKAAARG